MQSGHLKTSIICTAAVVWLLSGCSKSVTSTDRYAVTKLHPGATLLFFLDTQSQEKSSQMEARIVRSMSRALEEANAYVWVLSSKEFCPDVAEPFYSPEDILLLLQDAQFQERINSKRIQYIVLVYVRQTRNDWSTKTHSDPGGFAVYNKRESAHNTRATVIDVEKAEITGALVAECSASAGYGIGVAAGYDASSGLGLCCVFPFAWYGGETEDVSIRTLAASVAKFFTEKDATPNARHPEKETAAAAVSAAKGSKASEEEPKAEAAVTQPKPELIKRIKLRDRAEKDFSDRDLQKMIWERNFFNRQFNPGGSFPNAFVDHGDGTVTDKVTGLMWQKAGSPSEMAFDGAGKYVQELNSNRFGGYGDWRLPTMEELCSLLEGSPNQSGTFIDSLFDPAQSLCWSADANPSYLTANSCRVQAAFYVNFVRGETSAGIADRFLGPSHTQQARYCVKAVRTAE